MGVVRAVVLSLLTYVHVGNAARRDGSMYKMCINFDASPKFSYAYEKVDITIRIFVTRNWLFRAVIAV